LYVTANLMGTTTDYARSIELRSIPEKSNVQSSGYKILPGVLPANASIAMIPVVVNKEIEGLDLKLAKANLTLEFVPNESFMMGMPELNEFRLISSNFLPQPLLWNSLITYLGPFSQARYKFILTYFGTLDFGQYSGNINLSLGLQSTLRKL